MSSAEILPMGVLSVNGDFQERTSLLKLYLLPSEKRFFLRGKNSLPYSNFPFKKGTDVQGNKQEVTELSPLSNMVETLPSVPNPFHEN